MIRHTLFLSVLPFCVSFLLEAQLNTPNAGIVRYQDGTIHRVLGLPANYVVDGTALDSADHVSFSDAGGILAKDGRIRLVDSAFKTLAEYDSGDPAALVNIDADLQSAVAWLPTHRRLLYWNGTSFSSTEVKGSDGLGSVTSLWITGRTAKLLATGRDGGVLEANVSLDSGELISIEGLPGVHSPAFRQQALLVFHDHNGLSIANSSATIRTFPVPAGDLIFERMSSDTLHLMSPLTQQNWLLRLSSSGPSSTPGSIGGDLFLLPAISAHASLASPITTPEEQK